MDPKDYKMDLKLAKNNKKLWTRMRRSHSKENTKVEMSASVKEISDTKASTAAEELKVVSEVSHVHYEETDKEPCGHQDQGGETVQSPLEQFHTEEDFPPYNGDIFPEDVEKSHLAKKYRAMPEEYYTRTGLRPITPKNFRKWFDQAKGKKLRWHFWEIFSGSGCLRLIMLLAGLTVGFPIDMRYGWSINNQQHQNMLKEARDEFCPGVGFHGSRVWAVVSFVFIEEA